MKLVSGRLFQRGEAGSEYRSGQSSQTIKGVQPRHAMSPDTSFEQHGLRVHGHIRQCKGKAEKGAARAQTGRRLRQTTEGQRYKQSETAQAQNGPAAQKTIQKGHQGEPRQAAASQTKDNEADDRFACADLLLESGNAGRQLTIGHPQRKKEEDYGIAAMTYCSGVHAPLR